MTQDTSPLTVDPVPLKAGHDGQVLLLRVAGRIDDAAAPPLAEALAARTLAGEPLTHVILDLSGVRLLSPAGAGVLTSWADRLAGRCRRVLAAAATREVAPILYLTRAADVMELFPTVDAALAKAAPERPVRPREAAPDGLGAELRNLRAQVRTRPLIAQAQGVVLERYRLRDAQAAFHLLQESSQCHNLRLRVLASALVAAPRPRSMTGPWFPRRMRAAAPAARFLQRSGADPSNRSRVLDVLLDEALEITGTTNADLQLVDPALGVLVLERQRGFSEEFQDYFAHVGDEGTACAAARRSGARVTVADVATDPIFAGRPSREVILATGNRSVQSTPVMGGRGHCLGMISTHSDQAGRRLTAGEESAMDALCGEAACWLTWYHRTVVLDALEHLHRLAVSR